MKKTSVFLVDDHPIVRHGLTLLLNSQPDLAVIGEAESAAATLSAIEACLPDLLIVDISLKGPDGLDLLKCIRLKYPHLPVLVLSIHDELIYAERALRAGANGYVMKQEASEKILEAVRRLLAHEICVSERVSDHILQRYVSGSRAPGQPPLAGLSDREIEVFRLMGQGLSTRQIAEELHLSSKTVESHQAHLKEKLSLRSARELVQHAIEWTIEGKAPGREAA